MGGEDDGQRVKGQKGKGKGKGRIRGKENNG